MYTPSILKSCAAAKCVDFPIPEDGSCVFQYMGMWFCMRGIDAVGNNQPHRERLRKLLADGWRFKMVDRMCHILPPKESA